jgi:hypothetical protein
MSWGFVGSISISLKAESASNQELDVSLFLEPSSFFASWDYVDDYMCTALSPSAEPSTSSAEPTPSRCFVCLFSLVISTLVTGLLTIASLTEGNQRFGFRFLFVAQVATFAIVVMALVQAQHKTTQRNIEVDAQ